MKKYVCGTNRIAAYLNRTLHEVRIFALFGGLPLLISKDGRHLAAPKAALDDWKKRGPDEPGYETPFERRVAYANAFDRALSSGGLHAVH